RAWTSRVKNCPRSRACRRISRGSRRGASSGHGAHTPSRSVTNSARRCSRSCPGDTAHVISHRRCSRVTSTTNSPDGRASGEVVLDVQDLVKHFPLTTGILFKRHVGDVKAVDGVSLQLHKGETLGVVGESGCGKSTLAKLLMRLEEPTSGRAIYKGENIYDLQGKALRDMRRNIQIVFQDPYSSLNPRMTVGDIVGEPFDIHPEVAPKGSRRDRVRELLDVVGLNPEHINRYPHRFSGGQRQRIGIARGLALRPEIIICDEPVSALDVSVQAQVVNLLESLQDEFGLSYIFIAHDLSVVRHISGRVAVMYLGRSAEIGPAGGAPPVRPRGGDVPGPDRRDRLGRGDLREADASVHPGAAVGGAGARSVGPRPAPADHLVRRRPEPGEPAEWLPVPDPLLE